MGEINSQQLAALLSSLVSQLTLLILLLYPSSLIPSNSPESHSHSLSLSLSLSLISLLHHFLSSSETAVSVCRNRKRSRTLVPESISEAESLPGYSKLARVDSALIKNPSSFITFFNMTPSTFEWLSGLLDPLLECRDPVDSPLNLSAELRLGIGLYRLSSGSDYSEIATRFRVTDQVAKFCCKQLCRVLCTNFRFWVGFPGSTELDSVSKKFEDLIGLPNCCGVIDCTRFKVKKTSSDEEESVAAQLVVDSSCRILSIVAGFQGDRSNTKVLRSTSLFKDVQEGKLLNAPKHVYVGEIGVPQYLVAHNNEYPLLPWLMIPFDDPKQGSNEEKFNVALGLTRFSMAKTVASLKNWGILSKPIDEDFRNAVAYVGACAILHNALLLREDYSGLCDHVVENNVYDHGLIRRDDSKIEEISIDGCLIRNALATKARKVSGNK